MVLLNTYNLCTEDIISLPVLLNTEFLWYYNYNTILKVVQNLYSQSELKGTKPKRVGEVHSKMKSYISIRKNILP